jgi:hypothetical protein
MMSPRKLYHNQVVIENEQNKPFITLVHLQWVAILLSLFQWFPNCAPWRPKAPKIVFRSSLGISSMTNINYTECSYWTQDTALIVTH